MATYIYIYRAALYVVRCPGSSVMRIFVSYHTRNIDTNELMMKDNEKVPTLPLGIVHLLRQQIFGNFYPPPCQQPSA